VPLALTYVYFPESTTGVRAAALVEEGLRRRGVALALKSISNAQLFLPERDGGVLASGKFDLAYVPTQMGADPDDSFLLSCAGAVKNYMRYCDPAVDRLETQAMANPSQDRRRRAYAQIDRIVARDVPLLYLFNPTYPYAYRTRLHGFAPNAFTPTWNAWSWSVDAP
jgi:peptide/nickel transport system substrate-binding protein